jgi:hypothetical protein
VEFDPHAFLWWDPLKLAVLPVQVYDYSSDGKSGNAFVGAIGFKATRADGVTEAGRASHPAGDYGYVEPVSRSVVVGQKLFTISNAGALASDLATFADRGFVKLPVPQPPSPTPQPETVSSPNAGSGSASR